MSDTIHKQTTLDMLERDVENKYAYLKQNTFQMLYSLSSSVPLLKVATPSAEKWLSGKEKQFIPKVQDLVNMSVEASFVDSETSIEDGYISSKELFNKGLNELIQEKTKFTLESVDQILQILMGSKLSL